MQHKGFRKLRPLSPRKKKEKKKKKFSPLTKKKPLPPAKSGGSGGKVPEPMGRKDFWGSEAGAWLVRRGQELERVGGSQLEKEE